MMMARPFGEDGPVLGAKSFAGVVTAVGLLGALLGWLLVQAADVGRDRAQMQHVLDRLGVLEARLDRMERRTAKTSQGIAEIQGMLRAQDRVRDERREQ